MANLTESPIYEPGIFQLEKSTPPLGGAPVIDNGVPSAGHANAQGLQLANRTAWLKQQIESGGGGVTLDSVSVTPAPDKVVRADSEGKIDSGWLPDFNGEAEEQIQYTHKKSIVCQLPIVFPDYVAIQTAGGNSYLYPQGFFFDERANEILIAYNSYQGTIYTRTIAVYNATTFTYKSCFILSLPAGAGGGESFTVVYPADGNRYLVNKYTDVIVAYYNINTLPANRATLNFSSQKTIPGIYFQLSSKGDRFMVEDTGPTIGGPNSRTQFSIYDTDFNRVGAFSYTKFDSGFTGLTDNALAPYIPKAQGVALGNGCIATVHGGVIVFNDPTSFNKYAYLGPRLYSPDGQVIAESICDPFKMKAIFEANGLPTDRFEYEGVCVTESNKVMTLNLHQSRFGAQALLTGIVIMREFSPEPDAIDFRSAVYTFAHPSKTSLELGLFPRSNNNIYNPVTGTQFTTLEQVLDYMDIMQVSEFSYYAPSISLVNISGMITGANALVKIRNRNHLIFFAEVVSTTDIVTYQITGSSGSRVATAIDSSSARDTKNILATHERLIFNKKKILSLPLKNPEWDWLSTTKSVRFYPQTFCLDEYAGKVLIIDGTTPDKTVLVYDWPSGNFDRVFFCTGGLVSESAVVRMEGAVKYLYLRTTGDKLAKYDITSYPTARTSISAAIVTTTACGLNFMERNGSWTISDIASSALGNVRSRGKFIKTDSNLNVTGSVDCGDYLMGIYAGRDGETDVTKTQGVTDTGYGLVAQMGGQWVYPNTVTNYSQNGLRVFNYDGDLICEGLLQADKFRTLISSKWGFTPDLIESEGLTTANNGDVFSLTVTSNNGASNVSSVHGMLIMQEFAFDGDDFSAAAASRLGTFKTRGSLTTTPSGGVLIDPTTNTNITTIQQLLVAMQKSGISEWSMYTTGIPIVDTAGAAYAVGCLLTVTMFRSDIYYTHLKGLGINIRKRIYYDGSTWIEGQAYDGDGTTSFSASGVSIVRTNGGPSFTMSGPAANHRQVFGQTLGVNRWRLSLGDSAAESSGDVGSNFAIANYTDAGTFKTAPLQINRATGETQLTQVSMSGPVRIGSYTLTTLPSAATFVGYMIYVSNATGGGKYCVSNGTVWQILNTTTTVS